MDIPSTRKVHKATELQQDQDGKGWQMWRVLLNQGNSSGSPPIVTTVNDTKRAYNVNHQKLQ